MAAYGVKLDDDRGARYLVRVIGLVTSWTADAGRAKVFESKAEARAVALRLGARAVRMGG